MTCSTPPDNDCNSGSEFESYDKTGSCVNGRCSYVSHQTSCVCQNHACTTDPCIGMPCDSPPSAACTGADGNTLTTYATSGTCDAGSCSYAPTNKACTFGCTNGACNPDPCTGVPCNTPPPAACKTATTFTAYAATGTCSGAGICNYAPTAPNRVAFHGTPATPGPSDFLYDCPVGGCAAAVPYIAAWGGKSQSGIGTVVALSGNVYYLTEGSGGSRVLRCPGTDVSSCVQLTNGGLATDNTFTFAVDDTNLYYFAAGAVNDDLVPCNTSTVPCTLGTAPSTDIFLPGPIVAYGGQVYWWAGKSGDPLLRCAATGCSNSPTTIVNVVGSLTELFVDASGIYWITDAGLLNKCPLSGCAGTGPTTITTGISGAKFLKVQGTSAYWLGSSGVYRIGL